MGGVLAIHSYTIALEMPKLPFKQGRCPQDIDHDWEFLTGTVLKALCKAMIGKSLLVHFYSHRQGHDWEVLTGTVLKALCKAMIGKSLLVRFYSHRHGHDWEVLTGTVLKPSARLIRLWYTKGVNPFTSLRRDPYCHLWVAC